MGIEVKGAGDGVVIADRGCNDCYNRNSAVMIVIIEIPVGALDGEPLGVHW